MEITTAIDAKEIITRWFKDNKHTLKEIKDNTTTFHFEVDYPVGSQKRQRVIQPKEYPSMIVILSGVSIAPEHSGKLEKMKEDDLEDFYSEVTMDTVFLENSYDMNPDEKGIVKDIQFSYEFYFDSLTQTQLFKGLLLNHKSLLYIVTKFNTKFGLPSMPKKDELAGAQ